MAQRSGPPPIVFILLLLALAGAGWWFFLRKDENPGIVTSPGTNTVPGVTANPPGTVPTTNVSNFTLPTTVPSGTTVRIDGSTSMVTINENLKKAFQGQFPGTVVANSANGTDRGIQAVISGSADLAAVSRSLTPQEQGQGLIAVPVTTDSIALVVGNNNPFSGNLSVAQVSDIFQGKINNWSAVGGSSGNIRVINRPAISGTNKTFQELVLKGANFGNTPNITTLSRDATTPLLQALGNDGIGYATFVQVRNQTTVRVVPIDGLTPDSPAYPYRRQLYYVYKNANPAVQAFLGYATSPQGQAAIAFAN
ncbi:MAG: phosphate ABC transporter substrate-binding protein [Calothrix sp. SM1_7_51]|nr:phosphate ABC transporter substrate-binding protein [Calothrix sp. SM1_7_51]